MPDTNLKKNRDGSSIDQSLYAALLLAIVVPPIGLGYGLYLRSQGSDNSLKVIVASLIAAVLWVALALR